MGRLRVCSVGVALACLVAIASAGGVEETRLWTLPVKEGKLSPLGSAVSGYDGARWHLAFLLHKGKKWCVWMDGAEGPRYDGIASLEISSDGSKIAYAASSGGKRMFVVNGTPGPACDSLGGCDFLIGATVVTFGAGAGLTEDLPVMFPSPKVFSPDGKHMAYAASRNKKAFVVLDGVEGPAYDDVGTRGGMQAIVGPVTIPPWMKGWIQQAVAPTFSADGKHLAYAARKGDKWHIVIDGVEGPAYDSIENLSFSPDGHRVAYWAIRGDEPYLVVDGVEGPSRGMWVIFSPDGKHVALEAFKAGKWCVELDGKEGHPYDLEGWPLFSPDSSRFAYAVRKGEKWSMVLDGVEGPLYDDIGQPVYFGRPWWPDQTWDLRLRLAEPVPPQFSPDGKRFAYGARKDRAWCVVLDGKEGPLYDTIEGLTFSADGQRVAYAARKGSAWRMVLDGVEGSPYQEVGQPTFSTDGKHLAHTARVAGKWHVVLDGVAGPAYDRLMDGPLRFVPDGAVVYLGLRGNVAYEVRQQPATARG